MGSREKPTATAQKRRTRPATSPEARENRLISLAYDVVEERLLNGTATAQETTALLKLGSQKAQAELEKLRTENELMKTKIDVLESTKTSEELLERALAAFKTYSGNGDDNDMEVLKE